MIDLARSEWKELIELMPSDIYFINYINFELAHGTFELKYNAFLTAFESISDSTLFWNCHDLMCIHFPKVRKENFEIYKNFQSIRTQRFKAKPKGNKVT